MSGSGPYYLDDEGVRQPMGEFGLFLVLSVDINGIHAIEALGSSRGARTYIYMGEEAESSMGSGIMRVPHRLTYPSKQQIIDMKKFWDGVMA